MSDETDYGSIWHLEEGNTSNKTRKDIIGNQIERKKGRWNMVYLREEKQNKIDL